MVKRFLLLAALALALLLVGCAEEKSDTVGQSEITITDFAEREVIISVPVERIVLASGRDLHEVAALDNEGFLKKIVGLGSDLRKTDQDTYLKFIEKFPEVENIPEVGNHNNGDFNVEKVISLKPDVIIFPLWDVETDGVQDDIARLEQAGIKAIFTDFWAKPFENPVKSTLLLGTLLGKEERAQEIADFYQERVDEVESRLQKISKPKPKVYVEVGNTGPGEYGQTYGNTGWGAVVDKSGGMNIAENIVERMAEINPEYLLKESPDVIIISGSNWDQIPGAMRCGYYADPEKSKQLLSGFTERAGWKTLNAVKNYRVHAIFHGYCFRIYNFAAIQAFAKWFYPDEFQDLDPEADVREFHEKFAPVDYSGVWMLDIGY